jgi:porin
VTRLPPASGVASFRRVTNVVAAVLLVLGLGCGVPTPAAADDAPASDEPPSIWPRQDYTGDLWSRRYLTGDWAGWRTKLADHGVTLNVDMVQSYRAVVEGGLHENDAYGGSADYELHVDTDRLGLWPGGFLTVFGESRFGKSVNADAGVILAPDTDGLFPLPEQITTLSSVSYVQFLAPWVAVLAGKLITIDGDANAFASGRGNTQFSNLAFVFNPVGLRAVPYSALGGGALFVLPQDLGTLSVIALDALGRPDEAGFEDAFQHGTVISEELRIGYKPLGLPGHFDVSGAYTTRNVGLLHQDPRLLLDPILGTDRFELARSGDSWGFFLNFDQYLWVKQEDPMEGVGLFFRFGQGDERNNPFERFYSFGFGGAGIVPTRDRDTFGIGWYLTDLSDQFPRAIERRTRGGQGFEAFYNVEALPWLHVTPDLQILESSAKKVDTDVILGLRMMIDF